MGQGLPGALAPNRAIEAGHPSGFALLQLALFAGTKNWFSGFSTIPAMAAAYLFHICKNHPFPDGKKRTAVVAAELFLNINSVQLDVSNEDLKRLCLGVAAGEVSKEEAVIFFERHTSG